jgi:hypothetical protein
MIVPISYLLASAFLNTSSKPFALSNTESAQSWAVTILENELPRAKREVLRAKTTIQLRNQIWEARFDLPHEKIDNVVQPCFLYIDPRAGSTPYFKKGIQASKEVIEEVFKPSPDAETNFFLSQQNPRVPSSDTAIRLFRIILSQWFSKETIEIMGPYQAVSLGDTWRVTATHPKWKESDHPPTLTLRSKDATVLSLQL